MTGTATLAGLSGLCGATALSILVYAWRTREPPVTRERVHAQITAVRDTPSGLHTWTAPADLAPVYPLEMARRRRAITAEDAPIEALLADADRRALVERARDREDAEVVALDAIWHLPTRGGAA